MAARGGMDMGRLARRLGVDTRRERSHYEQLFDPATGLPTWALLIDRIDMALARAQRTNRQLAVFVIDTPRPLDGSLHDVVTFARGLRSKLRPDDTVARTGSETFIVICNEIERGEDVVGIARRLVGELGVSCGLGAALSDMGESADQLMLRATARMAG